MKFENKKWILNVALAGALSLGVASVAKAADSTAPAAATPAAEVAGPVWSVLAQESAIGIVGNPNSFNMGLENVRLKGTFGVDAADTLTVQSSFAANYALGFALLDAYDVHILNDINPGLAVKVGQFKTAFGVDGYASPDQLIRTQYSTILANASFISVLNQGNNWRVGVALDQTYSDLNIEVAAVQSQAIAPTASTKVDYVGRVQWKGTNFALGVSDYLTSTLNPNTDTFGANASVNVDVFQLDLEAIFGGANGGNSTDGYNATLSGKLVSGFQPAVWYEFNTTAAGAMGAQDLGLGLNFDLAAKTRLALDVDFTGASPNSIFNTDQETVQLQEVF